MAIPTQNEQINRVAEWLWDEDNEDRTAKELAAIVVNGIYDMWTKGVDTAPVMPHVGVAFKTPLLAKTSFVGWIGEEFGKEKVWVIDSETSYGLMMSSSAAIWRTVSMSSAKVGAPGINKDDWTTGQRLSLSQRRTHLSILAVGLKTVLMRDDSTLSLWADSNENLKRYYRKEKK